MSDEENKNKNLEPELEMYNGLDEEEMALDDARRVKVLSPGMLVFKRFIRNKLAVIGFGILFFMFTFSFLGPVFSPYTQTQVFTGPSTMIKDYAGAIYNTELRYTVAEGESFNNAARAQFLLALGKNQETFEFNENEYYYVQEGEGTYRILQLEPYAEEFLGRVNAIDGTKLPETFIQSFQAAIKAKETSFTYDGETYRITKNLKANRASSERDIALGSLSVFDPYQQEDLATVDSYAFRMASIRAITNNEPGFAVDGQAFTIRNEEGAVTILDSFGNEFAEISDIIVNPLDLNEYLSIEFKAAVRDGIVEKDTEFTFTNADGTITDYIIYLINANYYIRKETPTELIRQFEMPSVEHPLGLDNNGMDVMTRLMYGGRVSLMVGFVVVIIETVIGVIIGGISGYFGGAVDTALMRFVDLFNSIPFYPMVIIFGSVMDTLEVDPMVRIFLLMAILGILGWTGIARVVRGQILSLREQDFMVATEATGIRTSRRIFRHLVPNVMPLLIVSATAGLGGIIISEATLGFLGLGIKYPLASWGSIINIASDAFVMTNYWFMWIPAGLLILLTVLGFNFVGDGLRDAYDPKMKR